MIRLFVPNDLSAGAGVVPTVDQSRYLTSVMRLSIGAELLLFNGRDGEWRATIVEATKRGCLLKAEEQTRPMALGPDLDLIVAMVKRGRVETIVEKAAELGARRVRLTITRRTNVDFVKLGRLDAIAMEAAEQTGRLDVPEVADPEKLDKILDSWDPARRLVFCDEGGDARPMIEALAGTGDPAAILIGPEGGFAPEERERLRGLSFVTPVSLGPRILRADTAAISAMTLWQAAAGDWR
ncbi:MULTISPECIES: 16S rRNA (uracil(1498)-N(3))-methyltransferase [unclassified Caulobacter]|jgi:16S rRNA (uracil1498-N3)-methyltransferase|uniref:16S rRNA (uracil(1498)-N(3))-methyltransferase n=1 Tax=unclassified Caulobacter TaxID=2648921 RepID=UPI000781F948|nr:MULTISPECIES: 16S rRNA (uracil(1498)-N(3))-methyltransferase [unclassified Caulobacter]AZS19712.1 16S rRNA (uracil(1498)-N(3))-methyltransferase [Caulobacter sp. FWC26]